jgi:hypothetical protein
VALELKMHILAIGKLEYIAFLKISLSEATFTLLNGIIDLKIYIRFKRIGL